MNHLREIRGYLRECTAREVTGGISVVFTRKPLTIAFAAWAGLAEFLMHR